MHVLMLGWEFPPFISGGLGTACYGLTKALDKRGVRITFVLPRSAGADQAEHVKLLSPETMFGSAMASGEAIPANLLEWELTPGEEPFQNVKFLGVPAMFAHPYPGGEKPVGEWAVESSPGSPDLMRLTSMPGDAGEIDAEIMTAAGGSTGGIDYGSDLLGDVHRYARFCLAATRHLKFDVIHAHDWLTYPAAMFVARATGRPLVVHVHSTEFDRSGQDVNQRVYDIERRGMHSAMRVVTVSQLTRNVVVHRYSVPEERVAVVYNGVELEPSAVGMTGIRRKDRIVLYFGRITYQKGPEYFVRAAKRVLEVMDNVKFVVAGSGDMARRMIELAAELGIGHKILFTGFLRGDDIDRVFSMADLYVMPSVSEPFGIAPLEAMAHDVPVIISKSSGVSEVLSHVLKVDFWDIDAMADKIIAVLRHPPLSNTLREHGAFEVRRLTWDGAAQRCQQVYEGVVSEMTAPAGASG